MCFFVAKSCKLMKKACHILLLFLPAVFFAQKYDLFNAKNHNASIRFQSDTDLIFNRSRLVSEINNLLHPELKIGGYISSYFSGNDDDNLYNDFVLFPTLEPRKDQFSLNMALISLAYKSQDIRGNITLHYGDVPESSWPQTFNLIQEANGGFRIYKNLWADVGFFKTHIGIESFQPRENIASSMSIMNYYDPYFLSGAKLTYLLNTRLTLQAGVFNGYNEYLDNNRNKAFGLTAIYNPSKNISLTYNVLTCDESPDNAPVKHQRVYHNLYSTLHLQKLIVGLDLNFGSQQHSLKSDTGQTGYLYGALAVAKYELTRLISPYLRVETFSDPNRILTGSLDIGERISGTTAGIELMPYKTVSFNAEWRILEADNLIFRRGNKLVNRRNEFNLCLDLWF